MLMLSEFLLKYFSVCLEWPFNTTLLTTITAHKQSKEEHKHPIQLFVNDANK